MKLSRIVFGEPKPGMAQFAAVLAKLDRSEAYCNRVGTLAHDRVTDLPFTIPELGLNYGHPTALDFVSMAPVGGVKGEFDLHHMILYDAGAQAAKLDPLTLQAAHLCRSIYAYPGDPPETWDVQQTTAGVCWAAKFDGPRLHIVFRGSDTVLDWERDVVIIDPARIIQQDDLGPMWGGFLLGMPETWVAIAPLLSHFDEVVFEGHSLGAARADVAAGYALTRRAAT